jgi:hypothetical protein
VLKQVRPGVYLLKPALRLRVVALLALFPGAVILLFATLLALEHPAAVLFMMVGATFIWAGLWARGPTARFDLGSGWLTTGYPFRRTRTAVSSVAAIELVPGGRHHVGRADPFDSFQVNLVLRPGASRLNLTNHADHDAGVATGRELATAMGVAFHGGKARSRDAS